jgi:peptide/nickel transport system substrate-binding protein
VKRTAAAFVRAVTLLALLPLIGLVPPSNAQVVERPIEVPERFIEPPMLAAQVAEGALPPVEERLPNPPAVAAMDWPWQSPGRHGGTMTMLMGSIKDTKMMVVYGYARLVAYEPDLTLVADILESFEVEEGRIFTFHLRPDHKWSDGAPFTTEDFRYYWEDMANNEALSPMGPPQLLLVDGEPPKVEIIDETTVRYSWSQPNPDFLPALAGASPLYIFAPSHYLKTLHADYADPEALAKKVAAASQRNWAALHNKKDGLYKNNNPDLPTLEPWMLTTKPPSQRFVFARNPYYHRVDPEGRQLPYIDKVVFQIVDSGIIPAKTGAGEADLQARELQFDNYTFLKEGEDRGDYEVRLWDSATGSQLALYPNLNVNDPQWRALLRDVRFRRALSLAVNRREINQVIYYGLAKEGGNTVLEQSPLYRREYRTAWAEFNLERANALLDEIGLTARDDEGIRLMPDGRPLEIIVETAGLVTEEADVLELIRDSWHEIGIRLYSKPSQREVFRNRIFAGETIMSVWSGLENGLPTPDMAPRELAPTSQQQLQWPKWGQYIETGGEAGKPVDMPEAKRLMALLEAWRDAKSKTERAGIWDEMLRIQADQVFTIGTVAGVPQPVVISKRLRNLPEKATYSWDPGAHFGMYKPDTFWFAAPEQTASGSS